MRRIVPAGSLVLALALLTTGCDYFEEPAPPPAPSNSWDDAPWSEGEVKPDEVDGACGEVSSEVLTGLEVTPEALDSATCSWSVPEEPEDRLSVTVTAHLPTEADDAAARAALEVQRSQEVSFAGELRDVELGDKATLGTTIAGYDAFDFTVGGPRAQLWVRTGNVSVEVTVSSDAVDQSRLETLVSQAAADVLRGLGEETTLPELADDGPVTVVESDPCAETQLVTQVLGGDVRRRVDSGTGQTRVSCFRGTSTRSREQAEVAVTTEAVAPDLWRGLDAEESAAERFVGLRDDFLALERDGSVRGVDELGDEAAFLLPVGTARSLILVARRDNVLVTIDYEASVDDDSEGAQERTIERLERLAAEVLEAG